ncbi:hypothetical protein BS47DRAFT_1300268 [Hydnum rufescens UP504]|uniref:Ribosome biogenesis protein NSA1 n=1 Tax=Hydnum rufescens UP504 TaxID=1448309 RepID=A0A9P6DTC5_9AGAM|nr:hypothetical protein BS47DRAFT_1300268 [Hydnum rufescens UP504]
MRFRFFTGDDDGFVKSLTVSTQPDQDVPAPTNLDDTTAPTKARAVDRLAFRKLGDQRLLAVVRADGSASVHTIEDSNSMKLLYEWKEPRMRAGTSYIGLGLSETYTCTNAGHFRLTTLPLSATDSATSKASLPMRLCDFQLSPSYDSFAYGGDEVDLSVWDAERAFLAEPAVATPSNDTEGSVKKRKKPSSNVLFPGELWRAKNLPNDNLSLRQPVHVSSLTFLSQSPSSSNNPSHHIVTGSRLGSVRRYDTRAARRPVANWTQFQSVRKVQQGCAEHEVFVSDIKSNMYSVDTRNGRILCGYRSISGAVNSIAITPTHLASTSLDHFFRLHPAYGPPAVAGSQAPKPNKGETVVKVYMNSTPTAVVWDQEYASPLPEADDNNGILGKDTRESENDDEEDLWEGMDVVGAESDHEVSRPTSRRRRV